MPTFPNSKTCLISQICSCIPFQKYIQLERKGCVFMWLSEDMYLSDPFHKYPPVLQSSAHKLDDGAAFALCSVRRYTEPRWNWEETHSNLYRREGILKWACQPLPHGSGVMQIEEWIQRSLEIIFKGIVRVFRSWSNTNSKCSQHTNTLEKQQELKHCWGGSSYTHIC